MADPLDEKWMDGLTPEEREAIEFLRQHREEDTDVSGTEPQESATPREELPALVEQSESEFVEESNIGSQTDTRKSAPPKQKNRLYNRRMLADLLGEPARQEGLPLPQAMENRPSVPQSTIQSIPKHAVSRWPKFITIWIVVLCVVALATVWMYRGRYRYEKVHTDGFGDTLYRTNVFTGNVDELEGVTNPAYQQVPQDVSNQAVANKLWGLYQQYKSNPDAPNCGDLLTDPSDGKVYSMSSEAFDECSKEIAAIQWSQQHNNGVPKTVTRWVRVTR